MSGVNRHESRDPLPGSCTELRGELAIMHRGVVLPQHVAARCRGKRRQERCRRRRLLFCAAGGEANAAGTGAGATVVAHDAAATEVAPESILRAAACQFGWRPRPRFLLSRAVLKGVPEPPRRAPQPRRLRLLYLLPRWALRCPLPTAVERHQSLPPSHHIGRRQAPPDRARRTSLSLRPGLNIVVGRLQSWPSHAQMLARRVTRRSG